MSEHESWCEVVQHPGDTVDEVIAAYYSVRCTCERRSGVERRLRWRETMSEPVGWVVLEECDEWANPSGMFFATKEVAEAGMADWEELAKDLSGERRFSMMPVGYAEPKGERIEGYEKRWRELALRAAHYHLETRDGSLIAMMAEVEKAVPIIHEPGGDDE